MEKTSNITKHLFIYAPLALALAACGGGGGGGKPAPAGQNPPPAGSNRAPVANDISVRTNLTTPYVSAKLQGSDPDNDTLRYVLDTTPDGIGYKNAFIDANKGTLHVTLTESAGGEFKLPYKVTDGSLFSESANLTITIGEISTGGLGANDIPAEEYGRLKLAFFDGERFGAALGDNATLPPSIDLSGNFPTPGNQGNQSSCVGWAAAYALKSYHEKIEEQWAFSAATTFSPAWVYNQINGGQDGGSLLTDALQLVVDKGAASWQSMPYSDTDFTTQPSSNAVTEASAYKAFEYRAINSVQQMKAALANRNPVLAGISVYRDLEVLQGPNSVYNATTGASLGGHAITLVGYDDNKFNGAFKVINSWGVNWGDEGYFWLPYQMVSAVMMQALVLTDGPNTGTNPDVPVEPPVTGDSPNLQIANWSVEHNPVPGGAGEWTWEVVNAGTGIAPKGADVNLMLSVDDQIDTSDWYVVYEEIPWDLQPGESAVRSVDAPRSFNYPKNLVSGTYYLAMWVDDLQEMEESNEQDNQSFGNSQVNIGGADRSDLTIDYWWANWDAAGNGEVEYKVSNAGMAATQSSEWDINLVLSASETPTADNAYFLFYEQADVHLQPQEDITSFGEFNLYESVLGESIPAGVYYMSLWVDDESFEQEENEINNLSVGNQQVEIGSGVVARSGDTKEAVSRSSIRKTKSQMPVRKRAAATRSAPKTLPKNAHDSFVFNGNRLPTRPVMMKKVRLSDNPDGTRSLTVIDDKAFASTSTQADAIKNEQYFAKTAQARDLAVFPRTKRIEMPPSTEATHAK